MGQGTVRARSDDGSKGQTFCSAATHVEFKLQSDLLLGSARLEITENMLEGFVGQVDCLLHCSEFLGLLDAPGRLNPVDGRGPVDVRQFTLERLRGGYAHVRCFEAHAL